MQERTASNSTLLYATLEEAIVQGPGGLLYVRKNLGFDYVVLHI